MSSHFVGAECCIGINIDAEITLGERTIAVKVLLKQDRLFLYPVLFSKAAGRKGDMFPEKAVEISRVFEAQEIADLLDAVIGMQQ